MQEFIDKLLPIGTFLKVLSWAKIIQLLLLLILCALGLTIIENRAYINQTAHTRITNAVPKLTKISKKSEVEITELVTKNYTIIAIQIATIDFQRNSRKIIYTSTDHDDFRYWSTEYLASVSSTAPLFNSDPVNNKHTIDLINGEFLCYPITESYIYKVQPNVKMFVNTVCVVGIPPYYGQFDGVIIAALNRTPTSEEIYQLQNTLKSLSVSIYDRDVK